VRCRSAFLVVSIYKKRVREKQIFAEWENLQEITLELNYIQTKENSRKMKFHAATVSNFVVYEENLITNIRRWHFHVLRYIYRDKLNCFTRMLQAMMISVFFFNEIFFFISMEKKERKRKFIDFFFLSMKLNDIEEVKWMWNGKS
jgi:hypothetical protein